MATLSPVVGVSENVGVVSAKVITNPTGIPMRTVASTNSVGNVSAEVVLQSAFNTKNTLSREVSIGVSGAAVINPNIDPKKQRNVWD